MEIKRTLVELFPDPKYISRLVIGIENAITKSLERQKVQSLTHAEVKDRFNRCVKWAEILRGDLGWGTDRIVRALPDMLATELSGGVWEPNKRMVWSPEDGA